MGLKGDGRSTGGADHHPRLDDDVPPHRLPAEIAADLPATAYAARFGPAELLIEVDGATLDVTRGDGPFDLAFAAGPGIRRLISGELAPDRAIATGVVEVLRGRGDLLDRFASHLHLAG